MSRKLIPCKTCGKEIAKGVKKCVHCGADQRVSLYKIMAVMAALLIVVFISTSINSPEPASENVANKYDIKNSSNLYISDSTFEQLYDKSKNASFAWIDSLEETDFLATGECSLTIFDDNSAAFILRTADKQNIEDDSVLVTFRYIPNEKSWERVQVVYNKQEYGSKENK